MTGTAANTFVLRLINFSKDLLKKLCESELPKKVCELVLGKYLFLTSLLAVTFCTNHLLEAITDSYQLPFYYSLSREYIGIRANNLFNLLSFAEGDLERITMTMRIAYIVMLIPIGAVTAYILKQFKDLRSRMYALVFSISVMYAMFSSNNEIFIMTTIPLMFAFLMLETAFLLVFTRGKIKAAAAVLFTAAAQLIECRTVLYMLPVLVIPIFFKQLFKDKDSKKVFYKIAVMMLAAVSVLVIMQIVSSGSSAKDMGTIIEHLKSEYYNNAANESFTNIFFIYSIEAFEQLPELLTMTPLSMIFYYIQPDNLIGAMVQFFCIFLINNNFLCILNVIIGLIFVLLKPEIFKDPRSRLGLYITLLTFGQSLFRYSYVFYYSMLPIIALTIYHYRFFKDIPINIEEKKVIKFSAVLIGTKYISLIIFQDIPGFSLLHYLVSYQIIGFAPRAFIASVVQAIFGYNVSKTTIKVFVTAMLLCITLVVILVLKKMIGYCSSEKARNTAILLAFAFFVSPAFNVHFQEINIFKLDMFLELLTFLAVFLMVKNNKGFVCMPFICLLAMIIHPVFAATFFPIVFILMLYRTFIYNEGHFTRNLLSTVSSLGIVAAVFVWSSFVYVPADISVGKTVAALYERCDYTYSLTSRYVKYIWLDIDKEHIEYFRDQIDISQIFSAVKYVAWSIPLTITFVFAVYRSAKREKKLLPRLAYLAMGLSALVCFVPCLSETDYGRWMAYFGLTELIAVLSLTVMQPNDKKWYSGVSDKFIKRLTICITIVMAALPMPDAFIYQLELLTLQTA